MKIKLLLASVIALVALLFQSFSFASPPDSAYDYANSLLGEFKSRYLGETNELRLGEGYSIYRFATGKENMLSTADRMDPYKNKVSIDNMLNSIEKSTQVEKVEKPSDMLIHSEYLFEVCDNDTSIGAIEIIYYDNQLQLLGEYNNTDRLDAVKSYYNIAQSKYNVKDKDDVKIVMDRSVNFSGYALEEENYFVLSDTHINIFNETIGATYSSNVIETVNLNNDISEFKQKSSLVDQDKIGGGSINKNLKSQGQNNKLYFFIISGVVAMFLAATGIIVFINAKKKTKRV